MVCMLIDGLIVVASSGCYGLMLIVLKRERVGKGRATGIYT